MDLLFLKRDFTVIKARTGQSQIIVYRFNVWHRKKETNPYLKPFHWGFHFPEWKQQKITRIFENSILLMQCTGSFDIHECIMPSQLRYAYTTPWKAFSSISTSILKRLTEFWLLLIWDILKRYATRCGCFAYYNYLHHHSFCLISHTRDMFIIILCTHTFAVMVAKIEMKSILERMSVANTTTTVVATATATWWTSNCSTMTHIQIVWWGKHKMKSFWNLAVALSSIQYLPSIRTNTVLHVYILNAIISPCALTC